MKPAYPSTPAKPITTLIATRHNLQSGSVTAQSNATEPHLETPSISANAKRTLARTHTDYWKSRLFRRSYEQHGEQREVNDLYIRLQHGGRREFLPLGTTNKDVAAIKARTMDRTLKESGWEKMLAKFYPDAQCTSKLNTTIGDYLGAVRDLNCLRLRTFLNYQNGLRTIAAEAFGVKPDKGTSKFDYRSAHGKQSGQARWNAKIDAHHLEHLTPEKVTLWKRKRIARAGHSPAAVASAKRTVNSYIRCARSLFSAPILKELKGLTLPAMLPFAGVELEENGSTRYVSKINPQLLIAAARNDLKTSDPEAYKVFLLGLFAGLRRAEIDLLEWRKLDFSGSCIQMEQTEWLHLKSDDSTAKITVDPEVLAELREFMAGSTSPFVISSDITWKVGKKQRTRTRKPRNDSRRAYVRCAPVFDRLNEWLRGKGIAANKPLHELRKELGAIIATEQGIYAASRFLRHSDITTTARHYVDGKTRINVGLGKYLNPATEPLTGQGPAQAAAAG